MPRYIDADAILKEIYYSASRTSLGETTVPYLHWKSIVSLIKDAPAADVAPRAEVAEELINMALSKIQIMISAIKAQEGNGIITEFNGGAKTALEIVFKDLAELKKKYTGEK